MWLTESVRVGGDEVVMVPVAVVRTTTYANLQQKKRFNWRICGERNKIYLQCS